MAKILDKILPRPMEKLTALRREQQWLKTELDSLPEQILQKEKKQLASFGAKLNRKLEKSAFEACDKTAYAQAVLAEKLQKYDIKHYMDRRAANHGCIRQTFKAVHAGKAWDAALEKQAVKLDAIERRRAAYIAKLEGQKQAFLAKHPVTDGAEYARMKNALNECYCQREKELDAKYGRLLNKRICRLNVRLERCQARIAALERKASGKIELPENVLLRVEGLKMYFGGLKAVDDLTFDVKKGEIFGLIGPNGAGKTTVFNCITRFYDATGGNMYFVNKDGIAVDLREYAVHDVILQGITRTFQNVELVRELSVMDNLLVACTREYRSGVAVHALGLPRLKREERLLKEKAKRVLKFMDLENYAQWLAFGLPYGILKKVEIARALMSDAKLIIMDEPAAGLNDSETAELTALIRRIRDEFEVTILLVEHDMGLVMNVCDTVCAISFGRMLAIGSCDEIKQNKAVQEAYLGVEEDA